MKILPLVKDKTKIYMDDKHHYGITSPENIETKTLKEKYQNTFSFNAKYLYNALDAMKNMNDGDLDFNIELPKEPYPLILDNGAQCYLIAPQILGTENNKNFEKAYGSRTYFYI